MSVALPDMDEDMSNEKIERFARTYRTDWYDEERETEFTVTGVRRSEESAAGQRYVGTVLDLHHQDGVQTDQLADQFRALVVSGEIRPCGDRASRIAEEWSA